MGIVEDQFGVLNKQAVRRFTLTNTHNMKVQVINYGAAITTLYISDKSGKTDDIVLGFDNIEGYLTKGNRYFGATIGRVANRTAYSKFTLDGKVYNISSNHGKHHLHGGFQGFDKVIWDAKIDGTKVVFTYVSKDGEEGYPGEVTTVASYELTNDNELILDVNATSTKPTPVNICNHSYFNLAGHGGGADEIYQHLIKINASKYTSTDEDSIPTGKIEPVTGTPFDLQSETVLGPAIQAIDNYDKKGGFDHNFCIDGTPGEKNHVAHVYHPPSGRVFDVYSNQPGVQFYTSNFLPTLNQADQTVGKNGVHYNKHGAFCLETQIYPDSINHTNFPNAVVRPGDKYHHIVIYKFSVQ